MNRTRRSLTAIQLAALASVALLISASPAAAASTPVAAPASSPAYLPGTVPTLAAATGSLTATIDPSTVVATPTRDGAWCRLTARTTLQLAGSVEGTVEGMATADVRASCDLVTTHPPGTYPDTFALRGDFRGTVASEPVRGDVLYTGATRAGGDVSAVLIVSGDASAILGVRAQVGAAGTYQGFTVTP
jgi:hypothetical protein